jgi:hypothetical protein
MTTLFIPTKSEDQISHEAIVENSMTETEKLRALLAEARRVVGDEVCIDCGVGSQMLWGRIDAALAEPVEPLRDCICTGPWVTGHRHTDICREFRALRAERDEARAEVERLKADLDMVDSDLQLAVKRLTAECERLRKERDAACMAAGEYSQDEVNGMTTDMIALRKAAERAAYQRGAEAMREAAVGASVERARYWTETSAAEGGITTMEDRAEEARSIADDIRALPLLEDKR